MILCHKDGGLLHSDKKEDTTGLFFCGCISGYVRGFEPVLSRPEAIKEQIKETKDRIELYVQQGRDASHIVPMEKRLARLEQLK